MKRVYAVALAVTILAGCNSEQAGMKISGTAQESLKLLPAESNLVLFCDFQKINETPLAKQILSEFKDHIREQTDEDFESFKAETGLDPQKDFHNLLIGSVLSKSRGQQKAFVIMKGDFDENRIIEFVRIKSQQENREIPWTEKQVAGKTIYVIKKSKNEFGVCFADASTIYLGPQSWLTSVLDGTLGESLIDRPQYLGDLVKNVKYGDQLWMALDAKTLTAQSESFASELRRNMPAFELVESVVFSAKANGAVDFNGMLLCDSNESGQVMVDLMKGALAAAKLAVSNERTKVDELNKIKVFQEGKVAVLQGELTDEFFKTLQESQFHKWNEF